MGKLIVLLFFFFRKQALKEENKDPESFEFEIGSVGKTPAKKKAAAAAGKAEEESGLATSVSNGSVTSEPSLSDMQVRDECTDESQKEGEGEAAAATTTTSGTANGQTETLIQNISLVIKQEKLDDDEIAQQKVRVDGNWVMKERLMNFDFQAAEAKEAQAPAAEPATAPAEATDGGDKTAAAAGEKEAENEDSLNLEIGEEDEKLLHDASKCLKNRALIAHVDLYVMTPFTAC